MLPQPRVKPIKRKEGDGGWDGGPPIPGADRVDNFAETMAHHPVLRDSWARFGGYLMTKSTLPARDREIAILRTGWLCQSDYEWAQHYKIAEIVGLTPEEIARVAEGADAPGWPPQEADLIRATDQLIANSMIDDAAWAKLTAHYSTQQVMDLVFTVGQYVLVSMVLNSFGVQLEPGQRGLPGTVS